MKLIFGVTTVLLLTVFSVAYLYFSNLTVNIRSNDKILAGIPSDASVIFQFSNDKSMYDIFKDYQVFDAIIGEKNKQELTWLKEIFLNNQQLYSSTQGQKVFLSFHSREPDSVSFLWLMPLKEELKTFEVESILKKYTGSLIKITQESGVSLLEIKNNELGETFYLCIDKAIAKGSFSKALVLESLNKDSKKISSEFIKEISNSILKDNNALASLFINHDNSGFLKPFFKQNPYGNFGLFNSFSAYSSLNMNYKSDALMFNGITRITGKYNSYLSLFLKQGAVKNTIKRIIPYNISNSISYGLSDYNLFHSDLKELFGKRKELNLLNEQIQLITTETGINPDRDIKKLWGNEFSSMQLSTFENLAVIRISNGRQLQFLLEPLSSFYSDVVRKMNYSNLFYYYFGDPLKKFTSPFYTVTDNLVIISNSPVTVQRFLTEYNAERLLHNDESFNQFDQLVADQSNISFFIHFDNSKSLLRSLLKKKYSDIFNSDQYGLKDFYGLSYQLISNKDHFFTNFYLGNKNTVKADSLVYKTDSTLIN